MFRDALRATVRGLSTLLATAIVLTYRLTGRLLGRAVELSDTAGTGAREMLVGPVRVALLGRRSTVSVLATLLAPVLAVTVAWALSGVGFDAVREAVVGTWTGRDPALVVLLAAVALVALGAASSGVNSGLLPTTLLVTAPVFGAGLVRYGTEPAVLELGPVVSLPDAVGVAALFAVAFGVPLALAGFLLGGALRRVFHVFDAGRESLPGQEV